MVPRHTLEHAVALLRQGRLVAFPTETVYGLGADAENDGAVRRIFAAKGRPADHPLIVHLASAAALDDGWARDIPEAARTLAARFWPGPLTLILPRGPRAHDAVTSGQATVGLRVPAHEVALALLEAFGGGLAAPSANRFGAVSPTCAAHVQADLGERVDFVLDGGPCSVGIESTIVDLSHGEPRILRPGGVAREAIEAALGRPVAVLGAADVRASGQHASHYAPRAEVKLVARAGLHAALAEAQTAGLRVGILARQDELAGLSPDAAVALSPDDAGFARGLYAALRELDVAGVQLVLTTLPNEAGLGLAIADRLRKAAGPRS